MCRGVGRLHRGQSEDRSRPCLRIERDADHMERRQAGLCHLLRKSRRVPGTRARHVLQGNYTTLKSENMPTIGTYREVFGKPSVVVRCGS